ncbi:MAG: hypothetical protein IJ466_07255 [Clostridia bacterium]|nr:hypothetical protein [Clostridia bacterium]
MFNTGGQNYLDIDMSDLDELIRDMRSLHTPENFKKLMVRALRRTGSQVRTMTDREIRKEYDIKKAYVMADMGNPKIDSANVSCIIPIEGKRGIHGLQFKVSKPRGRPTAGRRHKIATHIVKGKSELLPDVMKNQGGNPPFIAHESEKKKKLPGYDPKKDKGAQLDGFVLTRKTSKRTPIVKVVGIGIPQMPMNEAKDAIQDRTIEILKKRIEHEHDVLMRRLVK